MSELNALFTNDDSVDVQLSEMRQAESVAPAAQATQTESAPQQEQAQTQDDNGGNDAQSEQVSESKTEAESAPKDEEYKPEEYQHNKNYKAAMEAERREKAELKKHFQSVREENEKLKQLYDRILKSAEEQEKTKVPSFDDDPLEALKYKTEQYEKKFNEFDQREQARAQQAQQQQAMQKFMGDYQTKVSEFAQATPDFQDAYKFALENRLKEYQAAGYDETEAKQLVIEDELAIVTKAFQRGENPAKSIYELAKIRGYAKQSTEQAKPNAQEKMETLQKGLAAAKSVNTGGTKPTQLTIEAINAMSDDEFDNVDWSKVLQMG